MKEKLSYKEWVSKYFINEHGCNFWISNYEKEDIGFAPSDLSHYSASDLKKEHAKYLKDKNDFIKYDESTNELITRR